MTLDLAPLGPGIGRIMVTDIAEQETRGGPVYDEPEIVVDANRPEVRVPRPVKLMKAQPWRGDINLKIECSILCSFLLLRSQPGQADPEAVGNTKKHPSLIHQIY
jgi:hypothetical protein